MDDTTDGETEAQVGMVLPGMLPSDGALASAPDAEERLARAVSRYLAIQALQVRDFGDGIGGVSSFRQRELNRQVLQSHEVGLWIQRWTREEGSPSWWLSGVSLDDGDIEQHDDGTISIRKRFHVQWLDDGLPIGAQNAHEQPSMTRRELTYLSRAISASRSYGGTSTSGSLTSYSSPDARPIQGRRTVRAGGALDRLRRLSLALADTYQWDPEQASTFVLTGLVPYSKAWAERLRGALVRGRRPREISPKHLELALFTAEREGEPLAVRMTAWNAQHPEWAYAQITNFGRDSREAVRRLEERMGLDVESAERQR
jgi:hypothetical protein